MAQNDNDIVQEPEKRSFEWRAFFFIAVFFISNSQRGADWGIRLPDMDEPGVFVRSTGTRLSSAFRFPLTD